MNRIDKNILKELIIKELNNTKYLKKVEGIVEMLIRQAYKESSYRIYAERFEPHLEDSSVGLFQLLRGTMKWLGFEPKSIFEYYFPEVQVRYALKYLDKLYSEFPEIHNPDQKIKIVFGAYNMGKGHLNKALKKGRELEEIHYEGKDTIQGKWATYNVMISLVEKYGKVSEQNININKRYVKYITEGDDVNV